MTEKNSTKLPRKIYSGWAFSAHEAEKSRINKSIYEEIKDRAELKHVRTGYAHRAYRVQSNPHNLSTEQLALIADSGNLCFGYRTGGPDTIVIHTD